METNARRNTQPSPRFLVHPSPSSIFTPFSLFRFLRNSSVISLPPCPKMCAICFDISWCIARNSRRVCSLSITRNVEFLASDRVISCSCYTWFCQERVFWMNLLMGVPAFVVVIDCRRIYFNPMLLIGNLRFNELYFWYGFRRPVRIFI